MAKRFRDTKIAREAWYRKLPPQYKCVWDFICDECDNAGVWSIDIDALIFYVGAEVEIEEFFRLVNNGKVRVEKFQHDKIFVVEFVKFQFGELSENCKPHKPIIKLLHKYGLFERVTKGLGKGINTLEEKETDTEEEKKKDFGKSENLLKNETPVVPINEALVPSMMHEFKQRNPKYFEQKETDFTCLREIAEKIHKWDELSGSFTDLQNNDKIRLRWGELCEHIKGDGHLSRYSIFQVNKHFQSIIQSFISEKNGTQKRSTGHSKTDGIESAIASAIRNQDDG